MKRLLLTLFVVPLGFPVSAGTLSLTLQGEIVDIYTGQFGAFTRTTVDDFEVGDSVSYTVSIDNDATLGPAFSEPIGGNIFLFNSLKQSVGAFGGQVGGLNYSGAGGTIDFQKVGATSDPFNPGIVFPGIDNFGISNSNAGLFIEAPQLQDGRALRSVDASFISNEVEFLQPEQSIETVVETIIDEQATLNSPPFLFDGSATQSFSQQTLLFDFRERGSFNGEVLNVLAGVTGIEQTISGDAFSVPNVFTEAERQALSAQVENSPFGGLVAVSISDLPVFDASGNIDFNVLASDAQTTPGTGQAITTSVETTSKGNATARVGTLGETSTLSDGTQTIGFDVGAIATAHGADSVVASRALGYETYVFDGETPVEITVNAELSGELTSPLSNGNGPSVYAEVLVFDALLFRDALNLFDDDLESVLAAAPFGMAQTGGLLPSVLDIEPIASSIFFPGLLPQTDEILFDLSTSFQAAPGQQFTVVFDLFASAPAGGTADFISSLSAASDFFTDSSGNPISGVTEITVPVPLPATLPLALAGLAAHGLCRCRRH